MGIADCSVLVVEDHDFQRGVLLGVLARLGVKRVFEAVDGRSALEILTSVKGSIDIVITDLDMPGMDGMEFIRRLGEAALPVSIILASALDRSLLAAVETMVTAYGIDLLGTIEKPATPLKLQSLIDRYQTRRPGPQAPFPAAPSFTAEEIAQGLERGEFEPFFQPKVELVTGRLKGAEALARWRHPRWGIVAPGAFIKTLEDNGMIDALTWIMLRRSAALCSGWRAAGLDMTVAVNLSVKSLDDPQLARHAVEIVTEQQLEPRHMVLEVTESAASTELASALENLCRLRMKGFGLSIDDYGTGYSSMQQLARIAFTELKIDQAFVRDASSKEASLIILSSSLEMARRLKISAVAEGVETPEDWDLLRRYGCDMAQGYLIAPPMGAAAFGEWAAHWTQGGGPAWLRAACGAEGAFAGPA